MDHSFFQQNSGVFLATLPETKGSHLKMDGWKINFLSGWPIFRRYVSFREGSWNNIFFGGKRP